MTPRRIFALALAAVVFAAAGVAVQRYRQPAPASPAVTMLFRQTLSDPAGQAQQLKQWQGRPLLVNFWATWCPPCVQEMPELSNLQVQRRGSLQIIGIGIDSPSNIREFSQRLAVSYPIVVGGLDATDIARQLGNQAGGLPFTVLIDATGQVRKTYLGRLKIAAVERDLAEISR